MPVAYISETISPIVMKFLQHDGMLNPSICCNRIVIATNSGVIVTSFAVKTSKLQNFLFSGLFLTFYFNKMKLPC